MEGLLFSPSLMVLSDALGQPQLVQSSPHATIILRLTYILFTRLSVADIITD